jgi:hypothetical protein
LLKVLNDQKYYIQNNIFDLTKGCFIVNLRIADLMNKIPDFLIRYKNLKLLVDKDFLNDIKFPGFSNNVLLPSDISKSLRLKYSFSNYRIGEGNEYLYFGKTKFEKSEEQNYLTSNITFMDLIADYKNIYTKIREWQQNPKPMLDLLFEEKIIGPPVISNVRVTNIT